MYLFIFFPSSGISFRYIVAWYLRHIILIPFYGEEMLSSSWTDIEPVTSA